MEIEKDNLWIVGGYYVDFDELGQFRIIGPNNHLFCGLIDIPRHKIKIDKVNSDRNKLYIDGVFTGKSINLYYPAMDDIRTMREFATREYADQPFVSFLEIRREHFDKLVPQEVKHRQLNGKEVLEFKRFYGEKYWYKAVFDFKSSDVDIEEINEPYKGYKIICKAEKGAGFKLVASTNDVSRCELKNLFESCSMDFSIFGDYAKMVEKFWKRTGVEIEHLIIWGKTSGDRFGTIFPRDWMESSDIGVHDLTVGARDYMYKMSLKNVNKKGEGWHEDVVGEYKFQHEMAGRDIFDRRMIDIEPHYIFGLRMLSSNYLVDRRTKEKTRLAAKYVLKKAREKDLILFEELPKKLQTKEEKYYTTGNWRDSGWAYKKVSDRIAPFDVNAVFYPEALRAIKDFQKVLGLKISDIDRLIKKWDKVRNYYRFRNKDGLMAYALALYDVGGRGSSLKYKKFKVNQLDESYLYTYSDGTKKEIESFCKRLLNKNYFYTDSGPVLIGRKNSFGYTTTDYHGLVIWTKQVSFVVLGLSKHLKRAIIEEWDQELQRLIKKTLLKICLNMIKAFSELDSIPELHYCNGKGKARLWTDQANVGGRMSKVQLWSAVGARRIFRKYYELMMEERYKI